MKPGDVVRFAKWGEFDPNANWNNVEKRNIGVLISLDKTQQVASILYEGTVIRLRSGLVEKAGKKDIKNEGR
tara:strand:+ start:3518 stop:3733 length:216 start_codon:yes stop_codon:yes gene_type:complete